MTDENKEFPISFSLGAHTTNHGLWAKHHNQISLNIGVRYSDGTYKNLIISPELQKAVDDNPSEVFFVPKKIMPRGESNPQNVEFAMLNLYNDNPVIRNIRSYSVGAMNTMQVFKYRIFFQIEDSTFILDSTFKSSGSNAINFLDFIDGRIEDLIIEIAEENLIQQNGISMKEDSSDEVSLIVLDSANDSVIIDMGISELVDHFVGVELYDFQTTII